MRIEQCHISKSLHDFPFCRLYDLNPYFDSARACVFFGCYDAEDVSAIRSHTDLTVIWWAGQDALDFKDWHLFSKKVVHVTERVKVYELLKSQGIAIRLLPCSNLAEPAKITPLGKKVFAYCPASYPEYHGSNVLQELQEYGKWELIIGDGSIPQNNWRAGACNPIYDQCFIGLVLSRFAGGGASVMELGLRGRMCVTNVLKLGNVINWSSTEDVIKAIESEEINISKVRPSVVIDTLKTIDFSNTFLNLNEYD